MIGWKTGNARNECDDSLRYTQRNHDHGLLRNNRSTASGLSGLHGRRTGSILSCLKGQPQLWIESTNWDGGNNSPETGELVMALKALQAENELLKHFTTEL